MNGMQPFATRQNSTHEASNGGHMQSTGSTFAFRKRWCQIDWRTLASVDIDRVVREMDFQTLQQNIFNVAFCNIDAEEFHSLDPNFVKLFKLGQLIIEYLMHSQQYLQENMSSLEQQLQKTNEELQLSHSEVKARVEEVKKVKKENKKRKKVIEAYQDMMNAGATGLHACAVCHKEFVSAEFMQSHMQRRHPDHLLTHNRTHTEPPVVTADMQKSLLEQMTNKLRETEEHLRQEMANREHRVMEENAREMEQWKRREAERHEQEVKRSVEPLVTELNKIQQEKLTMEQELKKQDAVIQALQSQQQSIQQANIIEQQNNVQARKRKRREEEAAEDKATEMKQLLETQMNMMQEQMKKQEKQWKKRMQEVTRSHQQQLAESNQKISTLEESLHHAEHPSLDPTILNTIQELQQRVHKQEEHISKQQQKKNIQQLQIRSASASPVSQPATPVKTATAMSAMYQQDSDTGSESETAANMLTVSSLTATMGDMRSQLQQTTQLDPEDDTDNDNDSVVAGEDEVDTAAGAVTEYTPFQHRPMIKTRFSHNQKMLTNMQHETSVILEQAFTQRGVPKDTAGLSDTMLEEKLRNLAIERQKRIQSHANFTEHRERLVQELNQMITATYTPTKRPLTPTKQQVVTIRSDKSRGHSPPPTASTTGGSLPTTPTKRHTKPPLVSKLPTSSTPQVAGPSSVVTRTQPTPATRVDDSSLSEESETDSVLEGAPPSTAPPPQTSIIAPLSPVKVSHLTNEQEDSPWDSESEASGDDVGVTNRLTSDNTKQRAMTNNSMVSTVKPFEPSSDSEETFSLTEISEIPAGEKAKPHHTTTTAGVKPAGSRATTSLTTVTAVDYDDMSDFDSDLEITQLT
ncbi:cilium assembly protein DZIP1L-like isoform X2 [Dysidea avara]|uniref:cilium assembly protein DZIP1L-like isoform X2 n=1 Tax=Dysidea avara TaxID=196820 RepID=UPI0033327CCB